MSYDSNLDRLTVIDLRAIAADLKISGRSKMKRAELVAVITRAEMDAKWDAAAVDAATAEHENEEIDLTSTIDDMISGWLPEEIDIDTLPDPDGSNTLPVPDGPWFDEADAAEQPDRASYYSGTVPCFERTTVDGIGYGCVNLGEHVEHNTALGAAWWTPTECVAITKYSAHEAFATAVFNGESVGSRITKVRGRWALQYGSGHVIRAKTLGKVAKLWAKALGFHATAIDIDAMN